VGRPRRTASSLGEGGSARQPVAIEDQRGVAVFDVRVVRSECPAFPSPGAGIALGDRAILRDPPKRTQPPVMSPRSCAHLEGCSVIPRFAAPS
jgi:hypothetical protein